MSKRNFTNLNMNPCKMCMPMGAAIAFKGIEGCMMLLHGSQGCSTYIRRHIATHYNEPMDIASSSLNEKGTIYGGARDLKKGLKNLIKLYNPQIIGISTTCLAETIGEDIDNIVKDFIEEENIKDIQFITASTPGYGGSHYEGYYYALRKIVEHQTNISYPNNTLNIIVGNISPANVRQIKKWLKDFGIQYTLLPDISNTLDAPFNNSYKKITPGGTSLEDIKKMSGAKATIEIGLFVPEKYSPGKYLEDTYGVPLYRCPLPIGIENTDYFFNILSEISEKEIPQEYLEERGRMLDAMIDSHKYNSEGKATIFGDPEIVYAITKLCMENGIEPRIVATGTKSDLLKKMLIEDLCQKNYNSVVLENADFDTIHSYIKKNSINLLIGHSDGKFIEEKENIPLIRIGFPIHDRVGGQRLLTIGYEGSTRLLDTITNTLLQRKYSSYRSDLYRRYYLTSVDYSELK
ncbi:nitrogenase component 1 [Defluviitalea phaphyphila]|uniref:nitrogenase component 1 n=1 Tax=Defluviitalea phaphyphila TaxID=1473580 RepID=UPI000731BF5B|nr:nitrogenase component 1 [Defluviitalea phaphyphila]